MVNKREIEAKPLKIDKILSRIELGDIKIPDFQRGFVWKRNQVLDLLDSLYKDFPIGSLLFWESHEKLNSMRNIGGINLPVANPNYPVNYVLDGQQRLSSIYAVFKHGHTDVVHEEHEVGVENHRIFDIYFDLEYEIFVHKSQIPKSYFKQTDTKNALFDISLSEGQKFFKLSELIDVNRFWDSVENLNPEYKTVARQLQFKFINYEIPVVTIRGREKNEVGVIFERINNTGTELNTLDLLIAWTWSDDFNLRSEINIIREDLETKDYGIDH